MFNCFAASSSGAGAVATVVVVASVSCIYGLGSPEEYRENLLFLQQGEEIDQRAVLRKLVDMR